MADRNPINAIFVENLSRRITTIPGLSRPVTCIEKFHVVQLCGCSLVPHMPCNYAPGSHLKLPKCVDSVVIIRYFFLAIRLAPANIVETHWSHFHHPK
jgi:hypothetical protein